MLYTTIFGALSLTQFINMQIRSLVPHLAIDMTTRHPDLIFFFFLFAEKFHFQSWMVQVSLQLLLSEVSHFTVSCYQNKLS